LAVVRNDLFDMKIDGCVMRGIFVFVLFFFGSIGAKGQLWVEDFTGEADGATTGTAGGTLGGSWSTSCSGTGDFERDNNRLVGPILFAANSGSEAVWSSNLQGQKVFEKVIEVKNTRGHNGRNIQG
jgi:hypothetical protein